MKTFQLLRALKSHLDFLDSRFELDLTLFTSGKSMKFIQQRLSLSFTLTPGLSSII